MRYVVLALLLIAIVFTTPTDAKRRKRKRETGAPPPPASSNKAPPSSFPSLSAAAAKSSSPGILLTNPNVEVRGVVVEEDDGSADGGASVGSSSGGTSKDKSESDGSSVFDEVERLVKSDRTLAAIELLRTHVNALPKPPTEKLVRLHISLGWLLQSIGKREEAYAEFVAAVNVEEKNAVAYRELGRYLYSVSNHTAALIAFYNSLVIDTSALETHGYIGRTLAAMGRFESAAKAYETAQLLEPDNPEWSISAGLAWLEGGAVRNATIAFSAATRADGNNEVAWYQLGRAQQAAGELEAAANSLSTALALDANYADAYVALGHTYLDLGRPWHAVSVLQTALKDNSLVAADSGIDATREGRELRPFRRDVRVLINLGVAHLQLNAYTAALESFSEAVKLDSANSRAFYNLGTVYQELGYLVEAVKLYSGAISRAGNSSSLYNSVRDRAMSLYNFYNSSSRDTLLEWAHNLTRIGDYSDATSTLHFLSIKYPEDATVALRLAEYMHFGGLHRHALSQLKIARNLGADSLAVDILAARAHDAVEEWFPDAIDAAAAALEQLDTETGSRPPASESAFGESEPQGVRGLDGSSALNDPERGSEAETQRLVEAARVVSDVAAIALRALTDASSGIRLDLPAAQVNKELAAVSGLIGATLRKATGLRQSLVTSLENEPFSESMCSIACCGEGGAAETAATSPGCGFQRPSKQMFGAHQAIRLCEACSAVSLGAAALSSPLVLESVVGSAAFAAGGDGAVSDAAKSLADAAAAIEAAQASLPQLSELAALWTHPPSSGGSGEDGESGASASPVNSRSAWARSVRSAYGSYESSEYKASTALAEAGRAAERLNPLPALAAANAKVGVVSSQSALRREDSSVKLLSRPLQLAALTAPKLRIGYVTASGDVNNRRIAALAAARNASAFAPVYVYSLDRVTVTIGTAPEHERPSWAEGSDDIGQYADIGSAPPSERLDWIRGDRPAAIVYLDGAGTSATPARPAPLSLDLSAWFVDGREHVCSPAAVTSELRAQARGEDRSADKSSKKTGGNGESGSVDGSEPDNSTVTAEQSTRMAIANGTVAVWPYNINGVLTAPSTCLPTAKAGRSGRSESSSKSVSGSPSESGSPSAGADGPSAPLVPLAFHAHRFGRLVSMDTSDGAAGVSVGRGQLVVTDRTAAATLLERLSESSATDGAVFVCFERAGLASRDVLETLLRSLSSSTAESDTTSTLRVLPTPSGNVPAEWLAAATAVGCPADRIIASPSALDYHTKYDDSDENDDAAALAALVAAHSGALASLSIGTADSATATADALWCSVPVVPLPSALADGRPTVFTHRTALILDDVGASGLFAGSVAEYGGVLRELIASGGVVAESGSGSGSGSGSSVQRVLSAVYDSEAVLGSRVFNVTAAVAQLEAHILRGWGAYTEATAAWKESQT